MSRVTNIVPGLAVADLKHEWILSLCLVIAIAAVIAPLLLMMGLKYGTIQTLRERLVEDPAYREIRPLQTQEYTQSWFQKLKSDAAVGFLLPTILPASSIIQVLRPADSKRLLLDLIPTAAEDPLLIMNKIPIPADNEAVLTLAAAEQLGIQLGDNLNVRATRSRKGKAEYGEMTLRIVGILPAAASVLPRIYTALNLVMDVERFKEGMAVSSRGWKGKLPAPYASYDGVLVLTPSPLPPILRNAVLIESGLADIEETKHTLELLGNELAESWSAYILSVPRGTITHASYKAVKRKLRGRGSVVLPFVKPFELQIKGQKFNTIGLSLSTRQAELLHTQASPWGGIKRQRQGEDLLQMLLPAAIMNNFEHNVEVTYTGKQTLSFPVKVIKNSHEQLIIPLELAAILRTSNSRLVEFSIQNNNFHMQQAGFRGFRLYAKSIDDVPALSRSLERQGIPVNAETDSIERIQILERGLTQLFWLIAVLGIGGGIAVLIASLYASVERKRKELAMLRLIGLSRRDLFSFPVYEGIILAGAGITMALTGYYVLAAIINQVFADEMGLGEQICSLPLSYVAQAVIITLLVAFFSAFLAAWKATLIEPAEAIREE